MQQLQEWDDQVPVEPGCCSGSWSLQRLSKHEKEYKLRITGTPFNCFDPSLNSVKCRHVLRNPALFIGLPGRSSSANLPASGLETFIGKKKFAYTSSLFS